MSYDLLYIIEIYCKGIKIICLLYEKIELNYYHCMNHSKSNFTLKLE